MFSGYVRRECKNAGVGRERQTDRQRKRSGDRRKHENDRRCRRRQRGVWAWELSGDLFTSRACVRGMNVALCTGQTVGSNACVRVCVRKRKRELSGPSTGPTDVWSCTAHPRPPQAASSCCQKETGRPGETGRGPMGRKQERGSFTAWYVLLDAHTMYPLRTLKNNI